MKNNLRGNGAAPAWRSLLFVPANVEKFVAQAHRRGADVVILDLEDSVPYGEKPAARAAVREAAAHVGQSGADVMVRINSQLSLAVRDIEEAICPHVDALMIAKVQGGDHIRLLDELVRDLEQRAGMEPGHTRFMVLIETPAALLKIGDILAASPRIVACAVGSEDFALHCNMEPTEQALLHAKQQLIIAASAAGIMPVGYIGSVAGFGDEPAFRAMVRRSRQAGFMAGTCVHPSQVTIANEEFGPAPDDVASARLLLNKAKEWLETGRGSFAVEGKMIDAPVLERAERLLRRAAAIAERQQAERP